ncbi:hypothetical protein EV175_001003 [Coemansia sp. RSA 1933]|nr:hypothetical protein EV175_001003 [Coemansia sp. RSA 1933]
MQKRGWKVTTLREFFPRNSSLLGLNVNHGLEIRIRLRPAQDRSQFLRYEDLLGTMLHELVHIVRGPHDAEFYKILDELKAEAEVLLAKGYTGDGFFSDGHRLGPGILSHNVPLHVQREKALQAAEARRRLQKLGLGGPPRKVGDGASSLDMQKRYTPAQMAAMAAERRWKDEKWCGEAMAGIVEETSHQSNGDGSDVEVVVISDSDPDDATAEKCASFVVID